MSDKGGQGLGARGTPPCVQSPLHQALGDVQIRRPSLPFQTSWPPGEMSQTQEEVQWKVGSRRYSGGGKGLDRESGGLGAASSHCSPATWCGVNSFITLGLSFLTCEVFS